MKTCDYWIFKLFIGNVVKDLKPLLNVIFILLTLLAKENIIIFTNNYFSGSFILSLRDID